MSNIIEEIDILPIVLNSLVVEVADTGERVLDCISFNTLRAYRIDNIGKQSVAVVYGNAECDLPNTNISKYFYLVEYKEWFYVVNVSNAVIMKLRIRADIISNIVFYIDEKGNSMMIAGYLKDSECMISSSLKDIKHNADFTIVSTVRSLETFNIDIKGVSSGIDRSSIQYTVDISTNAEEKLSELANKINGIDDFDEYYDEYDDFDSIELQSIDNIVSQRDMYFEGRLRKLLESGNIQYLCLLLTITSGVFSDIDKELFDKLPITDNDIENAIGGTFNSYKELCCNISGLSTTGVSVSKILDSYKYKDLTIVDKLYMLCLNNTLPYSSITINEEAKKEIESKCASMNFTQEIFRNVFNNIAERDFDFISKFTLYDLAFCNLKIGYVPKLLLNDMPNLYSNESKLLRYFNNEDMLDLTIDMLHFWKEFYKHEQKYITDKVRVTKLVEAIRGKNGILNGINSLLNFISIIRGDISHSLEIRLNKLVKNVLFTKLDFYDINTNTFNIFRWCRICEIVLGLGVDIRIDGVLTVDTVTNTSLSTMTDMDIGEYIFKIKDRPDVAMLIDKLLLF